eukprot:1343456-Amorphochlora_amoeboformis.AAC.2
MLEYSISLLRQTIVSTTATAIWTAVPAHYPSCRHHRSRLHPAAASTRPGLHRSLIGDCIKCY